MSRPTSLVRPLVRRLQAYTPGEQPRVKGLIKLNTNENPYPPAPGVLAAIRAAVDERLRRYPNPTADDLRAKLARFHACEPEQIIVGNGSDELLALAVRAFVEPGQPGLAGAGASKTIVQFPWPSYSLYPVLAATHGARTHAVPLRPDFSLPPVTGARTGGWNLRAALTFITTPNAPSGRGYSTAELSAMCQVLKGVVVLDEAYVDFAGENALELALQHPHVLVSRTFSKAYSLCFQRIGYFVGSRELVTGMHKIRDSYNVNGLGQIAAAATLENTGYYRRIFARIKATRERMRQNLTDLGWEVLPSQANFLFCRPAGFPAEEWQQRLRRKKILVRWFSQPEVSAFLRITIGSDAEADALLAVVKNLQGGQRYDLPALR